MFQSIKYWEMMTAEGKNDTVTVSYKLPFSPIMDDASFLLSRLGDFLYSEAWQFWSMGGFISKKGFPTELKCKPIPFVKRSHICFSRQWESGFSALRTVPLHSKAPWQSQHRETREQGEADQEKSLEANPLAFTIFLCLTSFSISLSLNNHWRKR